MRIDISPLLLAAELPEDIRPEEWEIVVLEDKEVAFRCDLDFPAARVMTIVFNQCNPTSHISVEVLRV